LAGPPGYQRAPTNPQKSKAELIVRNFVSTQATQNEKFKTQNLHINKALKQTGYEVDSMTTHNVENSNLSNGSTNGNHL